MTTPRSHRTVLAWLDHAASHIPSRLAVSDETRSLDWAGLHRRVADAAGRLRDAGIGAGDRVAIQLPNSIAFVEALLALPVPPSLPANELRRLVAEADVVAAISPTGELPLALDRQLASDADGLRVTRAGARPSGARASGDDVALVAFSSGTVTRPHLVARTHENLWWEGENFGTATGLGADDVVLGVVPLSHAHGLGNALLAALRARARLVLRSRFLRRPTLDVLAAERVTLFACVPFMLRMLAATDPRRRWDLSALRLCLSAGAPLPRETFLAFRERFGATPRQLYGLTEAGSVTCDLAGDGEVDPATVGSPLGTVKVTVEDARGSAMPAGEAGEIVIRSPAAEGGDTRPLRTRDLGRLDARGRLTITGRTSLFINAAGNKIDPGEVEAALRAHPAVRDVAVFGIAAPHDEQIVAAVVVLSAPATAETLRAHCRELLAAFKVPRVFAFRNSLPRSALGKPRIGALMASVTR
jgi:long-chain acyl-CoA synthetase